MTKHRLTWRLKGVWAGLVESGEGKERKGVRASAAMIFPSVAKDLGVISNPLTLTRGRVNGWDFALGCSSTFLPSTSPETRNKMRLSWPHTPAFSRLCIWCTFSDLFATFIRVFSTMAELSINANALSMFFSWRVQWTYLGFCFENKLAKLRGCHPSSN